MIKYISRELLEKHVIADKTFTRHKDTTLTMCVIETKKGWLEEGDAACVNPDTFDEQLGEKFSYNDALGKLMRAEAYLLTELGWEKYCEHRGIEPSITEVEE